MEAATEERGGAEVNYPAPGSKVLTNFSPFKVTPAGGDAKYYDQVENYKNPYQRGCDEH